jgi:hypothetical protein
MPPSACPLCRSGTIRFFNADKTRRYFLCAACAYVFVPAEFHSAPDAEKRRYDLHQDDPDEPGYRRFLETLVLPMLPHLTPGSHGLDFGCGPSHSHAVLFKERGFAMAAYDPFYAPGTSALEQMHDFIVCSEAIEHFFEPAREWALWMRLLRPGGWLGIMTRLRDETPDFSTWWYKNDETHVGFFSQATFLFLAHRDGLRLERHPPSVIFLQKPETQERQLIDPHRNDG